MSSGGTARALESNPADRLGCETEQAHTRTGPVRLAFSWDLAVVARVGKYGRLGQLGGASYWLFRHPAPAERVRRAY